VITNEASRFRHVSQWCHGVGRRCARARAATGDRRSWQRISRCTSWCESAFIQGLKATGFLEGENISIQWRWAEGQYNRLSSQATELVDRNVAVIVAFDVPAAFAAKAATKPALLSLWLAQIQSEWASLRASTNLTVVTSPG
jgi:hypothetical protein